MTFRLLLVEQNAVSLGGHYYAYTRSLAAAGREAGLAVTVLQNRKLQEGWGADITSIQAFSKSRFDSDAVEIRPWKPGNMAFDLCEAVRDEPSSDGDRILFPTLDFGELLQLLHLWTADPSMLERRTAHLLLRYDPGTLRTNLEQFRLYFDRINRSALLRANLLLHTDTDALSRELRALSGLRVTTLPVTFDQVPLRRRLMREPRTPSSSLTAIYLGDARLEKNYQVLPGAVAHLWADYVRPRRLKFVVQSNFNVPGGEPGILQAAQRLGQYAPDRVRLVSHPLDIDAYQDELAAADIVLLPYDADRYRLRSSGILVEAMAAGKPVVTTAGSWMAGEVDASHAVVIDDPARLGPAISRLVDDYPRFGAAARAVAPDVLEQSSGRVFIRALLDHDAWCEMAAATVLFFVDVQDVAHRHAAGEITLARARTVQVMGLRALLVLVEPTRGATPDAVMAAARRRAAEIGAETIAVRPDLATGTADPDGTLAELARRYDGLDLSPGDAGALRAMKVAAVWLSRAVHVGLARRLGLTEVPLIGALDDLDSFRIAIDEGRAFSSDDLAVEADLLRACRHLVAANPDLPEDWRGVLPDHPVIVAPLVLEAKPTPAVYLAGALDLADVAVRAGLRFELDDGHAGGRISRAKLVALAGLDMVIVVGDDPPSREGASWFVQEVYRPYLAGSGFTLLVVNAPDDVAEPRSDGLLIAGRCDTAGPLYAAARLVVVPSTDLARSTPGLWEAVSHAVPVVATTSALRGAPPILLDCVVAADTPIDLSGRIVALLASKEERRQQIERIRVALESAAGYSDAQDRLGPILGTGSSVALRGSGGPRTGRHEPLIIEWGSLIEAVNRLAADWLAGRPLDEQTLLTLLGYDRAEIANLLRVVVGLSPDSDCEPSRSSEQRGDEVILVALGMLDPDVEPRSDPADAATATFYSGFPLRVDLIASGEADLPTAPASGLAPDLDLDLVRPGSRRWRSTADREQDARVTVVSLTIPNIEQAATALSQRVAIPIVERRVLGRRLVDADWPLDRDGPALVVREGETVDLNWPAILTTTPSETWFEIRTNESAELGIRQRGRNLPVIAAEAGALKSHRVRIEMSASGIATLQISSASGNAAIFEARLCVLLGVREPWSLGEVIEAFSDPVMETDSERIALTLATMHLQAGRAFTDVVQASLAGRPVRGSVLRLMQSRVRQAILQGDPPFDALRSIVSGLDLGPGGRTRGSMEATLTALVPNQTTGTDPFSYVASPGLTAEICARFVDEVEADSVTCRRSGEPIEALPYTGSERRWRVPGRHPDRGAPWTRAFSFETTDGAPYEPVAVSIAFHLPAVLDPETGDACIDRFGFHAPEYHGGRPAFVWTGPRPTSRITLPIAPTRAGRIAIRFINGGLNQVAADFSIFLNDRQLAHGLSADEIVAEFEADLDAPASMEIRLTVAHVSMTLPDPRELGIAMSSVEVQFAMNRSDEPAG